MLVFFRIQRAVLETKKVIKVLFLLDPRRMIRVQPRHGHVVEFLDKTLYDDYLCLVASTKQQILCARIWKIRRSVGLPETLNQLQFRRSAK